MSIREVVQTATADASRVQRMVRVVVTDDSQLYAIWRVMSALGVREVSVPVSDTLNANIVARPAFQTMLDNIRDDTFPRTGA